MDVRALPGVRVAAPGGAEAYGAGVGKAFGNLAEAGLRMAADLEDAETLEAFNAFKRDVSAYHNDPDKGVLNRLGKETIGLYSEAETWMDNKAEEYVRKMKSPRMVQNFRRMAGQTILSQGDHNSRHEAQQIRAFRQAEADAAIKTALDDAAANWQSDAVYDEALDTAMAALELKTRGFGDEARRAAVAELDSGFAAARLSAMVQVDPMAAEAWYKEHKGSFTAAARGKAEEVLERETRAYKLENIRDDLIERYGMDYAAARKEILEKYKGEEEQRALALYEGWYGDQKRIQAEREEAARENVFRKLQTFTSAEDAMAFALKNAKSVSGYEAMRRFIKYKFNPPRETKEGVLTDFMDSLENGEYDTFSPERLKIELQPNFSQEDWKEYALPALRERRAEVKSRGELANRIIADDIRKKDEKLKNNNALLEKVKRRYLQELKAHPEWGAEERLAYYAKLTAEETIDSSWNPLRRSFIFRNPVSVRGIEKMERDEAGETYNKETGEWEAVE
jgi:hypothetical protein